MLLRKLKVWAVLTPVVKAQLGALVAESLQNGSTKLKKELQDKLLNKVSVKTKAQVRSKSEIRIRGF